MGPESPDPTGAAPPGKTHSRSVPSLVAGLDRIATAVVKLAWTVYATYCIDVEAVISCHVTGYESHAHIWLTQIPSDWFTYHHSLGI